MGPLDLEQSSTRRYILRKRVGLIFAIDFSSLVQEALIGFSKTLPIPLCCLKPHLTQYYIVHAL